MQHKRKSSRLGVLLAVVIGIGVAGLGMLMARDIPAPQHMVEKPLDAKAFLEQKQP